MLSSRGLRGAMKSLERHRAKKLILDHPERTLNQKLDTNILGAVMKNGILRKTNPTLVVAEDHGGI